MIWLSHIIKINLFQRLIIAYQVLKDVIWGITLGIGMKKRLSLPCPCAGCLFGGFSKNFDNYNIETQKSLLSQGSCEKYTNTKVSFTWTDWVYPKGRQGVHDKLQMKRAIINHFSRFIHLEYYRDLISINNIKFFQDIDHGHEIYHVPFKWQKNIQKHVELKMKELPTTKEN